MIPLATLFAVVVSIGLVELSSSTLAASTDCDVHDDPLEDPGGHCEPSPTPRPPSYDCGDPLVDLGGHCELIPTATPTPVPAVHPPRQLPGTPTPKSFPGVTPTSVIPWQQPTWTPTPLPTSTPTPTPVVIPGGAEPGPEDYPDDPGGQEGSGITTSPGGETGGINTPPRGGVCDNDVAASPPNCEPEDNA